MNSDKIIIDMLESLADDFDANYTERELVDMKNNRFYKDSNTEYEEYKYQFVKATSLYYLYKLYQRNDIGEKIKNEVFKKLYYGYLYDDFLYNFDLYNEKINVIPSTFLDEAILNNMVNKKKTKFISNVLKASDNPENILSMMRKMVNYQRMFQTYLKSILADYAKCENVNLKVYNEMFKDLCKKDTYGYDIHHLLMEDDIVITSSNIVDIIDNITLNGNDIRMIDKTYTKSRLFYDLISRPAVKKIFDKDDIGYIELLKKLEYEIVPKNKIKKV